MSETEPKTIRELYFYMQGEFETINSKLKLVFWVGGLAGMIFSGIIVGFFKLIKWIK